MLLQLYRGTQQDFTYNGQPLRHTFDEHVVREDGFYLTFKLKLDDAEEYKQVKLESIIGAMTPDGMNYFRVYDVIPKRDHVEVTALMLFYDLDNKRIKHFSLYQANGVAAFNAFKANFVSGYEPFTFDSSVTELHDFSVDTQGSGQGDYYSALEIINRMSRRWDSEFMLNGYDVRMVKRLGTKTDALLYEKKNISEFEFETSTRKLVTRIHAVSRWTLDREDAEFVEDAPEDSDVNDREIRVTVDSPLINEYSQVYEREYTNNDLRTEKELSDWAKLKYTTDNMDKPSRSIEVKTNIIDGTEINFGDELVLRYLVHDFDETIRCVGYDFDPKSETFYGVTLGDWRDSFGRTFNREVADVSDRQLTELANLKHVVQIVRMRANGKNRSTAGPMPVPNPQNGDLWWYHPTDRPDEVELRIYNGESGLWERKGVTSEQIDAKFREIKEQTDALDESLELTHNATLGLLDDWEEFKNNLELPETDLIWNIIGDDGRWVYSDNRLFVMGQHDNDVTSNEVVVTLEDGEKVFTHNGEGFSIGNDYTFSFANPRFVERPNAVLTVRRNVDPKQVSNITVDCHYPPYPDYSANNDNRDNIFNKCYHQIYTVTAARAWYVTQSVEVDITQNETVTLPVVYKTGTLTVTHNDATLEVV